MQVEYRDKNIAQGDLLGEEKVSHRGETVPRGNARKIAKKGDYRSPFF